MRSVVPSWVGSETLDALNALIDIAGSAPAAVARRAGLSTSELHALRHLSTAPMGPADIARLLGVTTAAASGVVDRLTEHGHAERHPHPDDGRRTQVHITESGRAEVLQHLAPMFTELARLDAALTEQERQTVLDYLTGAIRAIRNVT
ncbi:MAG: MarR family transcriptional regulator [Micrococcales bacterium]|nr:MAG: MarR family transcriptional regulator [Micrococcales bacterium]PIE28126.1 MAG: MarR family transcriptional regulator [Micrococcales bacterium]